ncbi:MAG: hypothetical protein GQ569_02900 [Methylococcaceae bacterium]|nr:hypothetical protein [Methylococcaceae bacterium]
MYAEKLIVKTDRFGKLQSLPKLPANQQFEAIFLAIENTSPLNENKKRSPHPDIAGQLEITGDIINSVAESEWNLPQ